MSDFTVQLVSATIASSTTSATVSSPSGFTEVGDMDRAFFLPATYPAHSAGWGRTTGTLNNSLLNTSADASLSAIDDVVFNDGDSTIARTNACQVWLLEYVGPDGGPNEVIVRAPSGANEFTITIAGGSTTADSAAIVGITSFAKCVPIAFAYAAGNTNVYNTHLISVDLVNTGGSTYVVRATRTGTTGAVTIRGRVLEFKGANWGVQRVSHSFSAGNTNEDETVTTADPTHSFVISTLAVNSTNQPAQATYYVYLSSSTNLRHRLHSKASGTITAISYVITNPLLTVAKYGTPDGTADFTGAGSGAETHNVTVTAVSGLTQAMVIGQAGSQSTANTAAPCLYAAFDLSSTTNVRIRKSEALGDYEYVLYVLDWSGVVSARIDSVSSIVDGSTFTISGVFGASPAVTYGGASLTVNSSSSSSITCTAAIGTKFYGASYTIRVADSVGGVATVDAPIAPDANTRYANLASPLLLADNRITATLDLTGTEQVRWTDASVIGTGVDVDDVEVFANGAFRYRPDVEAVTFSVNDGTGWGTGGVQTLSVPIDPPVVSTIPVIRYVVGQPFQLSLGIYATGWESISITGTLPAGLSISATDGVISGTPTAEGAKRITAHFTNESGTTDSNAFVLVSGPEAVRNMTTSQAGNRRRFFS